MITTEQFEHKLIEYLDGELSDAEKREVEEYLQAHPEAIELKGDFSRLCAAGKSIRESTFPADLLLETNRKLAARLADSRRENVAPTPCRVRQRIARDRPQPDLAAELAATVAATRTRRRTRRAGDPPSRCHVTQRAALADIANSLLHSDHGDLQRRAPVR